eukprot:TRINITY_DN38231_c0_g1_i1.p1 TRINITY_DN38231_c0_g1~~TRINITY_DN38231_c0_g1_i1.p1  ORF type:complete len:607 (-),score=114.83 TRINITY_DN38231_c0_g1_i1:21-1841(-)
MLRLWLKPPTKSLLCVPRQALGCAPNGVDVCFQDMLDKYSSMKSPEEMESAYHAFAWQSQKVIRSAYVIALSKAGHHLQALAAIDQFGLVQSQNTSLPSEICLSTTNLIQLGLGDKFQALKVNDAELDEAAQTLPPIEGMDCAGPVPGTVLTPELKEQVAFAGGIEPSPTEDIVVPKSVHGVKNTLIEDTGFVVSCKVLGENVDLSHPAPFRDESHLPAITEDSSVYCQQSIEQLDNHPIDLELTEDTKHCQPYEIESPELPSEGINLCSHRLIEGIDILAIDSPLPAIDAAMELSPEDVNLCHRESGQDDSVSKDVDSVQTGQYAVPVLSEDAKVSAIENALDEDVHDFQTASQDIRALYMDELVIADEASKRDEDNAVKEDQMSLDRQQIEESVLEIETLELPPLVALNEISELKELKKMFQRLRGSRAGSQAELHHSYVRRLCDMGCFKEAASELQTMTKSNISPDLVRQCIRQSALAGDFGSSATVLEMYWTTQPNSSLIFGDMLLGLCMHRQYSAFKEVAHQMKRSKVTIDAEACVEIITSLVEQERNPKEANEVLVLVVKKATSDGVFSSPQDLASKLHPTLARRMLSILTKSKKPMKLC